MPNWIEADTVPPQLETFREEEKKTARVFVKNNITKVERRVEMLGCVLLEAVFRGKDWRVMADSSLRRTPKSVLEIASTVITVFQRTPQPAQPLLY